MSIGAHVDCTHDIGGFKSHRPHHKSRHLLTEELNRIRESLKASSRYRKVRDDVLGGLSRKRGRPRRRRLPRGGSSRTDSDLIVITALQRGNDLVGEIREFGNLSQSRVYRSLRRLKGRKLVTSLGWPRRWSLVNDPVKIRDYEANLVSGLQWAQLYTPKRLKRDLELDMHLRETGDEAIRRYVRHILIEYGSTESFLAKEKELEQEKKKEKQWVRFTETERRDKGITYLSRRARQKSFARYKRDH